MGGTVMTAAEKLKEYQIAKVGRVEKIVKVNTHDGGIRVVPGTVA